MALDCQIVLSEGATGTGLVPSAQKLGAYPEICKSRGIWKCFPAFNHKIVGVWCSKTSNPGSLEDQDHICST